MRDWYLIRTKTGSEQIAQQQLQHLVDRTLLPLGKMQVCQRDAHFIGSARSFQAIYLRSFVWESDPDRSDIRRASVTSCGLVNRPPSCQLG